MAVVCRGVANLRSNPGTQSELVTQELLGRSIETLVVRKDWVLCRLSDGYRGWLPLKAVRPDAYVPSHIVTRRFAEIKVGGRAVVIAPLGSLLETTGRARRAYRVTLPDGSRGLVDGASMGRLSTLPWAERRLRYLIGQVIGTPYLWGGKSTFGFDCSGLVQTIFEFLGRRLPRDSREQALVGTRVGSIGRLRAGDLVFFRTGRSIDHVAIHLGDSKILHASGAVVIESLDAASAGFRPDLVAAFSHGRRLTGV
jgi:hypothetical protein